MEIEFNPGQYAQPGTSQSRPTGAGGRAQPSPVKPATPFERAQAIQNALNQVPAVRPERVDHARERIADVKYPPDEMMDRIAHLLAMNVNNNR